MYSQENTHEIRSLSKFMFKMCVKNSSYLKTDVSEQFLFLIKTACGV